MGDSEPSWVQSAAEKAAVDAGYIERCEYHADILLIVGDEEDKIKAFRNATGTWKTNRDKCTLKEMRGALQDIIDDATFECPHEGCPNAT